MSLQTFSYYISIFFEVTMPFTHPHCHIYCSTS